MKRFALGVGAIVIAAASVPLCLTRAEESLPPPRQDPPKTNPTPAATVTQTSGTPDHRPQGKDLWATPRTGSTVSAQPPQVREQTATFGCHTRLTPQPAATLVPTPVNPVVVDLVAALSETKSKGAFVAAVLALAELGPESRPAIPAILRHGERLGVFDDAFEADAAHHKGAPGRLVAQALAAIASGNGPGPEGPPPIHPAYGYAGSPYSYGACAPIEACAPPRDGTSPMPTTSPPK